ncbi:hypothetical protein Q7C_1368 [Methylophaga frappieri]|uniref:Uncharacterized protein n=1 Tax=Methylophaga frappieri (strain ATCC BAA-2434 / DSM 25690 / JAM7) TaxID=754477 RepID=I1YHX5_METFJ|nr:hypothetical protein Q7C_1368 [Methylophaga frappieri]
MILASLNMIIKQRTCNAFTLTDTPDYPSLLRCIILVAKR